MVGTANDVDRVDRPAGQSVYRIEHLKRPYQVEFVDRWNQHYGDLACGRRVPRPCPDGFPRHRLTMPTLALRSQGVLRRWRKVNHQWQITICTAPIACLQW